MLSTALPNINRLFWFALYVRTRRERAVDEILSAKGYETFVPMMKEHRVYERKTVQVEVPCFPGYVFCKFNPFDRLAVVTTPFVYKLLGSGQVSDAISEIEIAAIRTMVQSPARLERHADLAVGDGVYIISGPLTGLEGVLLRSGGSRRVAVSVGMLRRSISAEVAPEDIVPASLAYQYMYRTGAA
jgi:transcription antitermination factor NusG